jgi:hypothetical protein
MSNQPLFAGAAVLIAGALAIAVASRALLGVTAA